MGRIEAVDAIQHRRLAGAIGANDGADFAFLDFEADIDQCVHGAKGQTDILDPQQRVIDGLFAGQRWTAHAACLSDACSP